MLDITPERLELCKKYMIVDHDEDDVLIRFLLSAADEYLSGAGIERSDNSSNQYDLVAYAMTLESYETRGIKKMTEVAQMPAIRQNIVQLKLRSAYGGGNA